MVCMWFVCGNFDVFPLNIQQITSTAVKYLIIKSASYMDSCNMQLLLDATI